jgi:hypothetical protein
MPLRPLLAAACLLAAATAPAARAADTVFAADPAARQVTALDGAVVWVSGASGHQVLMVHTAAGAARVPASPAAEAYRSIDLGRDAAGRLVLTYQRCRTASRCSTYVDDLRGRRTLSEGLAPPRCSLTTAPALWRSRSAFGVVCHRGGAVDAARSGLYVMSDSGRRRRLPLPRDAVRFGATAITSVDLRGSRVAAVAADVYEYVFSQTVTGRKRHSFLAAASEGDSDEHAVGVALGTGGALWSLTDAEHAGDPNEAVIFRATGGCLQSQRLDTPAGPDEESSYRAIDLAADGSTLYLVVPGTGIVTHAFSPARTCEPA